MQHIVLPELYDTMKSRMTIEIFIRYTSFVLYRFKVAYTSDSIFEKNYEAVPHIFCTNN